MKTFNEWFQELTGHPPHPWQEALGAMEDCPGRLIRIPTGFGKTMGVLIAWMYHRIHCNDERWPRRLLWVLPMRVLVEQTVDEAKTLLKKAKLGAQVHTLMGGVDGLEWQNAPEECAVLVGTQDMLISRALNRGYAAPRARWPMEFGLLHTDALWIMDEVQLMGVGLATSAQLQAFRELDRVHPENALRPCVTWWMSATLQPAWLESVDTQALVRRLDTQRIAPEHRTEALWKTVKPIELQPAEDPEAIKKIVLERHAASIEGDFGRITLVILNTVDRALDVYKKLKQKPPAGVDVRLVHSRFRPHDREKWRTEFLCKDACAGANRIIVATQVVEAGVDVSATTLITDLAPWPGLVQRFGRAARWGGSAQIVVLTREIKTEKDALPYLKLELEAARDVALSQANSAAQAALEDFEVKLSDAERAQLFPFEPAHLLLRHEWEELFDTTPDLSGADIDVSRFIRTGEERDVQVFWRALEHNENKQPIVNANIQPVHAELCSVQFLRARKWLCGEGMKAAGAWVWDWLDEKWRAATNRDFYPGQTVLVDAAVGGYGNELGWSPESKVPVLPVPSPAKIEKEIQADTAQGNDALSEADWKTIATHGREAGQTARDIAAKLAPGLAAMLDLAGRWHDIGKMHDCFQGSIRRKNSHGRIDYAKAPDDAWPSPAKMYHSADGKDHRRGLRHELASMLALFSVLIRHAPDHPALLGPWRELLTATGHPRAGDPPEPAPPASAIEKEILALDADNFDLLAYLICAHHGKVRHALHASPSDQDYPDRDGRGSPIRGVREGDVLPPVKLFDANGALEEIAALKLTLAPAAAGLSHVTGRSWTERVLHLIAHHGPAKLAWLEALLRAADVRASKMETPDTLLKEVSA